MKNDFSFMPKINEDGVFTPKVVIKREDDAYQKIHDYCLTQILETPVATNISAPDLQTMAEKEKKNMSAYLVARAEISFALSHQIVRRLAQIPSGTQISPEKFMDLSDLVYSQIARKERLLKQLISQYQDVLVTAKNSGKKPSSVRCSLLLNPRLMPNPQFTDEHTGKLKYIPGSEVFHNDTMLRYYLKRFKENIQQRAIFKKHVMGYFWVKCHLKNQNSVYLHMNLYIDSKFEEIHVINMVKEVWEKISTETKPGVRQPDKIKNTLRKSSNFYYSPEPGGILFYTKNKNIPLSITSNDTTHYVANACGVTLATLSGTGQLVPMLEDFDGTLSATNKRATEPLNQRTFPAYLLQLAKTSCILPWSDAFAASKIVGSTKK